MVGCILTYCPKAAVIVEILEEYIVDVHFLSTCGSRPKSQAIDSRT